MNTPPLSPSFFAVLFAILGGTYYLLARFTSVLDEMSLLATPLFLLSSAALGALVIAPFLLAWLTEPISFAPQRPSWWLERCTFLAVTVTLALLIFSDPIPAFKDLTSPYQIFIPLIWSILRLGPRFTTAALLIIASLAAVGTALGTGPFAGLEHVLISLQLFTLTIASITLFLSSAVAKNAPDMQGVREIYSEERKNVGETPQADRTENTNYKPSAQALLAPPESPAALMQRANNPVLLEPPSRVQLLHESGVTPRLHQADRHTPNRKRTRHILIVDTETTARSIALLLTQRGHPVRVAKNGAEALATLANFRPDLVFLDARLDDLVTTLRSYLEPPPAFVALSNFTDEEERLAAPLAHASFDTYLTKPVLIAELEKVLAA